MTSAYHQKFLRNGEVKKSNEFDNQLLNHGLSIYEVIRIINGKALFFKEHYERLISSAHMLSFDLWIDKIEIIRQMDDLSKINNVINGNIEIIYNIAENGDKTFLCLFIEDRYPTVEMLMNGVPSDLHFAERENPNAKIINLDLRAKTNAQISEEELYEVLLVDRNGFITEGSRSNVFFIKDETVYTTPIAEVLPGITRLKVFEMCERHSISLKEIPIKSNEIAEFDAAFYTGTSPNVLPISNIGDIQFNPQLALMQKMISLFDKLIEEHLNL